eukprot:Lankesteria_metandrocarpae@DN1365_c0_g1_i2.p1
MSVSTATVRLGEAQLYETDIELVEHDKWFNDSCISFFYEHLKQCWNKEKGKSLDAVSFALIDPALVFWFTNLNEDQLCQEFIDASEVRQSSLTFIPISDHLDASQPGGMHWSLLILVNTTVLFADKRNSTTDTAATQSTDPHIVCLHFDTNTSFGNINRARCTAATFMKHINPSVDVSVDSCQQVECAKQLGGTSCGPWILIYTEAVYRATTNWLRSGGGSNNIWTSESFIQCCAQNAVASLAGEVPVQTIRKRFVDLIRKQQ